MPGIPELVATTAIVTEFIKVALSKANITIKGIYAVILAVLASAGTVLYHWVGSGEPFMAAVTTFLQVVVAATIGYKFLTEKLGNNKPQ